MVRIPTAQRTATAHLARKLRQLLAASAHTNELHVKPIIRFGRSSEGFRESMESADGYEPVARATLRGMRDRGWLLLRQIAGGGARYTLTRKGAKAIAEPPTTKLSTTTNPNQKELRR